MRLVWNVTANVIQIEFVRWQEARVNSRARRPTPPSSFIARERFIFE